MTEDEAKQKWCPFARVSSLVDGETHPAANRLQTLDHEVVSYCIASDCMAWRWVGSHHDGTPPTISTDENENRKLIKGYCGLAGKP